MEEEVGRRLGWPGESREGPGALVASLQGGQPFEDTNPALRCLTAHGRRLGIVSNVDDRLLAATGEGRPAAEPSPAAEVADLGAAAEWTMRDCEPPSR